MIPDLIHASVRTNNLILKPHSSSSDVKAQKYPEKNGLSHQIFHHTEIWAVTKKKPHDIIDLLRL